MFFSSLLLCREEIAVANRVDQTFRDDERDVAFVEEQEGPPVMEVCGFARGAVSRFMWSCKDGGRKYPAFGRGGEGHLAPFSVLADSGRGEVVFPKPFWFCFCVTKIPARTISRGDDERGKSRRWYSGVKQCDVTLLCFFTVFPAGYAGFAFSWNRLLDKWKSPQKSTRNRIENVPKWAFTTLPSSPPRTW